ncbi:MAG: class I SAM-dependent methyltransferase, partial [Promethearchaeota archaeon]
LSEIGIEIASSRSKDFGLEGKVQFKVGDICATTFPDNYFDAAISIDALVFIPEVSVAISEVSRILHSESKFLFTTWEKKRPSKLNDYRLFLRNAGFKIEVYNETPDWERLQREFYQLVLDNKEMLIKDMGKEESLPLIKEAESILPVLKFLRRIFVVAEKI